MQKLLTIVSIHHHHHFFGFIITFLFSNHLGEFIYDPPLFKRTL